MSNQSLSAKDMAYHMDTLDRLIANVSNEASVGVWAIVIIGFIVFCLAWGFRSALYKGLKRKEPELIQLDRLVDKYGEITIIPNPHLEPKTMIVSKDVYEYYKTCDWIKNKEE